MASFHMSGPGLPMSCEKSSTVELEDTFANRRTSNSHRSTRLVSLVICSERMSMDAE